METIQAVQPVAVIAGFPQDRQPQLESGDMIARRFTARAEALPTALNYTHGLIRAGAVNQILWITRIFICNNSGGDQFFLVGRTANLTIGSFGSAVFNDFRLPGLDIVGQVQVGSAVQGTVPTILGGTPVSVLNRTTIQLPGDWVLKSDGAGADENLVVASRQISEAIVVGFEGVLFERTR